VSPPLVTAPVLAQEVVKIGFASPLTGGQANYGKDNQNGAQMAIDELNAQKLKIGGKDVKFELMAEDDQADPKMGPLVAQKVRRRESERRRRSLQFRRVDSGVVGLLDRRHSAALRVDQRQVHAAGLQDRFPADGRRRQAGQGARRIRGEDAQAEAPRRDRRRDRLWPGTRRRVRESGEGAGGTVTKHEHTNDKAVDFAAVLTTIKATNPEAIFFGGYDQQAGPMAKQMKQLGMDKVKLMGGETVNSAKFIELAGPAARGAIARHRAPTSHRGRAARRSPTSTRRASAATSVSTRRISTMA
jgi:branched-chain amino acid transport system substrate-binding protein